MYHNWERTGFVWEQYADKTGEGRRSRAFTGWSACVILLMGLEGGQMSEGGGGDGASHLSAPTLVGVVFVMMAAVTLRRRLFGLWRRVFRRKWQMQLRTARPKTVRDC